MKGIIYLPTLISELSHSDLFLDTNSFIGAISYPEIFDAFFSDLKKVGCAFLTIPSVVFEFTRGSASVGDFNKRTEFISTISAIYPIERYLDNLEDLVIILQKIQGNMSYTDFLLIACLYKFHKSFLISANLRDFPVEILDRKFVVTIDNDKDIKNYGIYQFSTEKFNKAAESILRS